MNLETRYRRLLRLYPRSWRERREEELVATYLDTAPPERTRPSMRDGLDVAAGATRTWLRTTPPGLRGGARIAGLVGLSAMGALSGLLFFGVEFAPGIAFDLSGVQQGFVTDAGWYWLAWICVAAASPFLPGTWSRRLGLLPLLGTSMLVLKEGGTPMIFTEGGVLFVRPERSILLAAVVLGATALLHHRGRALTRWLPALSTVAGAAIGWVATVSEEPAWIGHSYIDVLYTWESLRDIGFGVAAIAVAAVVVSRLRRRAEGAWAFLLLGPAVVALTFGELTMYLGLHFGLDSGRGGFRAADAFLVGIGVIAASVEVVRLTMRLRTRRWGRGPQAS